MVAGSSPCLGFLISGTSSYGINSTEWKNIRSGVINMLKGLTIVFDIYACKSWQGFKPDSAYTLGLGSRNLLDMLKLFF